MTVVDTWTCELMDDQLSLLPCCISTLWEMYYVQCCCRHIEVFQAPHLLLVCTILVHKKLINCLRWHPQFTAESELSVSPCRLWLASASNESVVHVYNLEKSLSNGDLSWHLLNFSCWFNVFFKCV